MLKNNAILFAKDIGIRRTDSSMLYEIHSDMGIIVTCL